MMRIGWSSAKKKVGIGRLIEWLVGIPSLRGFEEAEAISLKIPSKILYCVIPRLDRGNYKIPSLRGVSETKQSRSKLNKS